MILNIGSISRKKARGMGIEVPRIFANLGRSAKSIPSDTPDSLGESSLLSTFESLNLGGFWSTDAEGRITYLSPTVRSAVDVDPSIAPVKLIELFQTPSGQSEGQRSLALCLARKSKFERVIAQSARGDQPGLWSVSGLAQFNQDNDFLGFQGHCVDVTSELQTADESSHLALHDPLTGLANRRHMAQLLNRTINAAKFKDRSCAVLLIDLDRFKQVNDTLGHTIGDGLLTQVAERLVAIVGLRDAVARIGGDEFQVVIADEDDRGKLGELAERIISMLSQPYTVDENRCIIGASIGIAISPFDGTVSEDLIRNADLALYAAKHGGRGRFRFFCEDLLKAAEQRRQLEEDLHDALARNELELAYQPIVDLRTNQVTCVETLVRWNHPIKGMISPALFIPIAEESSLITQMSEWILAQACADAAQWPSPIRVAVNISPRHFLEKGFPEFVEGVLHSTGLKSARLELEITEGVFLHESGTTDQTFKALKAIGARLALDDFGTGYSSLAYLKTAPFDKIKIDQSFVRDAARPAMRNQAIIAAIVALAGALDMETTAEGVETFEILDIVKKLKVSHVQGYIFSKAISNETLIGCLEDPDWEIQPSGPAFNREERVTMYRKIGAIHEDHYYQVVLRNLSISGALIEGLECVPVGTDFVLDFGEGQLVVAKVRRSSPHSQGLHFERPLVNDGNGGLCTSHRVSPYMLLAAGLPKLATLSADQPVTKLIGERISLPAFAISNVK